MTVRFLRASKKQYLDERARRGWRIDEFGGVIREVLEDWLDHNNPPEGAATQQWLIVSEIEFDSSDVKVKIRLDTAEDVEAPTHPPTRRLGFMCLGSRDKDVRIDASIIDAIIEPGPDYEVSRRLLYTVLENLPERLWQMICDEPSRVQFNRFYSRACPELFERHLTG